MGIHQLVLTKHHFKRLRRLNKLRKCVGDHLDPGDEKQPIDDDWT